MLGIALYLSVRSAEARAGEALLGFGSELLRWESLRSHTTARRLTVNGLELGLVAASTELGVPETLDRFHTLCSARGPIAPEAILASAPERDDRNHALDGIFRQESQREGVLACIDTGGGLELGELARRLEKFRETGDLGAVGELRYVLARRDGGATTVLVVWTEGRADILGMFPTSGDAPGRDPAGIPRPKGSRRLLSAAEHGAPYSVTVYDAGEAAPKAVRDGYAAELRASGWTVHQGANATTLALRQGSRTALIRTATSSRGRAIATVVELE